MSQEPIHSIERIADELSLLIADLFSRARYRPGEDLSHQAVRVIHYIGTAQVPPRVDDVRRHIDRSLTSTSDLLSRLQKKKLIEKRRCLEDERVVRLSLTKKGQDLLRMHTMLDPQLATPLITALEEQERKALVALLSKMLGK